MTPIGTISILLCMTALGWSLFLWWRVRNWRVGLLTIMLAAMAFRHWLILADSASGDTSVIPGGLSFVPELTVGALAILAVLFLWGMISELRRAKLVSRRERLRASQQAAVAQLGLYALGGADLTDLIDEATRRLAETLDVEYCKVLEQLEGGEMLLRGGVGWKEGLVGSLTVGSGKDSQAGYTLLSSEPVIVDDLRTETRFSGPALLHDHGVVSGVSVILHGPTRPFGVLGIHTRKRRSFSSDDVNFLQAVANVLAESVRRELAEDERAHLEEQLRHSQKMEAAGTLATGVAHDFGNLTMAIAGYVDLARSFTPKNRDIIKALDGIDQATRQANDITKSLLTFSKRTPVERRAVDLGQLISESVEMLRHMLPASVQIVTDIPTPSDLWIEADATQIQQVLMNLAINARDAMPEGGQLKISLRRRMANAPGGLSGVPAFEEGTAVLIVEDTGTGMSADVQQRVFEPFFTTKTRDRGTGLGMAVVHGIITQHHGTIGIESSPQEGTCITVAFPCCAVPGSSELGQHEDPDRSKPAAKPGSGQTVMLAEKDRAVRAILMTWLRKAGYKVLQASDGIEAMRLLAAPEAGIRLALLDADLPGKNGLACLQEIRQKRPDLPVVLMTASSEVVLEPHYADQAMLLQKPFPLAVLTDVVARMMAITEPAEK